MDEFLAAMEQFVESFVPSVRHACWTQIINVAQVRHQHTGDPLKRKYFTGDPEEVEGEE